MRISWNQIRDNAIKFAKEFESLTTTGTKMNGRINEHTILLTTF